MAWEDTGTIAPMTAGAAITALRAVKVGASDNNVIQTAAATDLGIGVAKAAASAAGQGVPVQVNGVTRIEAGAAISRGTQVSHDSVGRAITAASTNNILGVALEAAGGAGEIISVALGPYAVKA